MLGPGTYFHESNIFITEILGEFFLLVLLWVIKPRNAIILNGIIHYYDCSDWAATCALSSMTNTATQIAFIDEYFNGSVLVQAVWKWHSGESKGRALSTRAPRPNFLHYHVVFGKTLPNNRLAHPHPSWVGVLHWEILDPPLENKNCISQIYFYCVLAHMFAVIRTMLLWSNKHLNDFADFAKCWN